MANQITLKKSTTASAAPSSLASGEVAANVNTGTPKIYLGKSDGSVAPVLMEADVQDTPTNGVTTKPVSSNWAYDHENAADPHTGYRQESADVNLADGKTISIDDTTPGTDHTGTGIKGVFTAGESLVFGDVCYMKSDGKMWKADANGSSTYPAMAICMATLSANNTGDFFLFGVIRDDSWAWTVGGKVYLSTTAGAMTQTVPTAAGDRVQTLGVAIHADYIYFMPSLNLIERS